MKNENNILIAANLSVLLWFAFPLGAIIGPIIVLNIASEKSQDIKNHIRNIINFQIIWAIMLLLSFVLYACIQAESIVNEGININQLLYFVIAIILVNFIYPIIVSIIIAKTKRTKFFYPTIIRFIKYK